MFQQCEEPRFTIEQIDLLQRLRRTGIKQAEVVHALDTLDHLDPPNGKASKCKPPPYAPPSCPAVAAAASSSSVTSCATQTDFPDDGLSPSGNAFPAGALLLPLPAASTVALATVAQTNGKLSPPQFPLSVAAPGYSFETGEEDVDVDEKVEDLMRRDSAVIKDEVKSFLANRRISQAVVAQVTGATLAMRAAPLALEDMMEWHQAPPTFTPGAFRLRRGNRFTWKKECLAVMESYFSDNQYPDEARREEIAAACNAVIQKPGKKLQDFEKVTSLKVYNWFANHRKDLKRRANIEAAILESHGIDVQSPGGQSNSDEVDANDFPEQSCDVTLFDKRVAARPFAFTRADLSLPTQVPTLLPSWLATLAARGGVSGQRGGGPVIGRSLVSAAGVSWSPLSPSLQDEAAVTGALTEPPEMAAGDQVEGAGPGVVHGVKTEVIDD
ncbi:homeobox-containing protein 1-like isoform X3 [Nerophis lumbriciformis]|uniref:homeobox-containing protein 1-like isoform X3 n=1 Tax=Nerophis lumbriciformis TaxID=546530 RepID=UPI002AE0ACDE|nr:homeobox-containing protein 1-like isoform X3 [Nerophis lumbriciformis]